MQYGFLVVMMKVEWINNQFVLDEEYLKENTVRWPNIVLIEVIRAAEQNARARGLSIANPAAYLQKVFQTAQAKKEGSRKAVEEKQCDLDDMRARFVRAGNRAAQDWLRDRGLDYRGIQSREDYNRMCRELVLSKAILKGGL